MWGVYLCNDLNGAGAGIRILREDDDAIDAARLHGINGWRADSQRTNDPDRAIVLSEGTRPQRFARADDAFFA